MRKCKPVSIIIAGLDTPERIEAFQKKLAEFWIGEINKKVGELDIPYDEKIKLIESIVAAVKM